MSAAVLILLNALDALLSLWLLQSVPDAEFNPLLASLYAWSPIGFVAAKICTVSALSLSLSGKR